MPWPLALWHQCRLWGALPHAGGVLDQNDELMGMIETCLYAERLGRKKLREFKKADRDYCRWLGVMD